MILNHLLILWGCALWSVISAQQYGAIQLPEGLSPRYYLGTSQELEKRQSGVCAAGQHSCLDVNVTACCDNNEYCVVNNNFQPACCAIGSNCGLPCASSAYQCQSTITVSGTASVTAACCPRSCTNISAFKCASSLGGGCCSYGFMCGAGGSCSSTIQATTSKPAIVSEIPSGCTTSQSACPSSIGGGCCGIGWDCTVIDNSNYCATASYTALRTGPDGAMVTGISETSKPKSGLSSGAKAGIGGGIAGVLLIIIGVGLYFCVRHRRNAGEKSKTASVPTMSQSGSAVTKSRPSPGRRQTAADYFGPHATAGPYTADTPTPGTSPFNQKGVPLSPQGPGDIAAPVEIDSRDHSNVTSPGFEYQKGPEVKEYPFELP